MAKKSCFSAHNHREVRGYGIHVISYRQREGGEFYELLAHKVTLTISPGLEFITNRRTIPLSLLRIQFRE